MTWLPSWFFATFLLQALGPLHKSVRRRRQVAVVAIFGLLPLQRFHPAVQHLDLPIQILCVFLQAFNGLDCFFEGFVCGLLLLLELEHFLVFLVRNFPPSVSLCSQLS